MGKFIKLHLTLLYEIENIKNYSKFASFILKFCYNLIICIYTKSAMDFEVRVIQIKESKQNLFWCRFFRVKDSQ